MSVIVPAYNTAEYIGETLTSVFAQTFSDYEVIVVNDGSPDTPALEAALAPFRDRIRYLVQPNMGLSGARNTGIRAARAELIALLDSDDLWEPDYLDVHVGMMRADSSIDVVYPNASVFGELLSRERPFMDMHRSEGPATFESVLTQRCNVMVSVTARRRVLEEAGLFDERLRSSEDFDMWLRILHRGGRMVYHRRPLVRSRLRATSLSADPVWMCGWILRVLDKADEELPLDAGQRALLAGRRAHYLATLRFHEGKRAFFAGDSRTAVERLREANTYLRRPKITLAVWLVRLAPGFLLRAYDLRDRLVFGASTRPTARPGASVAEPLA